MAARRARTGAHMLSGLPWRAGARECAAGVRLRDVKRPGPSLVPLAPRANISASAASVSLIEALLARLLAALSSGATSTASASLPCEFRSPRRDVCSTGAGSVDGLTTRVAGSVDGEILRVTGSVDGEILRVSGSVDGEILRDSGRVDGTILRVSGRVDGKILRVSGRVDGFTAAENAERSKKSVDTRHSPLTGCPTEQSGASSGIGFASASALSAAACAEAFDSISLFTSRLRVVCLPHRRRRQPSSSSSTAPTPARMRVNASLE